MSWDLQNVFILSLKDRFGVASVKKGYIADAKLLHPKDLFWVFKIDKKNPKDSRPQCIIYEFRGHNELGEFFNPIVEIQRDGVNKT